MDDATRFRAGDPATIARVSRLVAAVVHSRAFFIPVAERVELIQAAIVQLWDTLASMEEGEPRNLDAFVRAVTYRRCVDWMRRDRPTEPVAPDAAAMSPDPEATLLAAEEVRIGRWVLEALGARCRELIRLHSEQGLTFRQIAEAEGRLEKTVRNQMSKCLASARALVERMRRRERLGLDAFGGRAMTHDEAVLLVPDLVLDRLAAEQEAEVQAHVAGCSECAGLSEAYRMVTSALNLEAGHPLALDLVAHVMGDATRPEVEGHLASCPPCSEQAHAVRAAEREHAASPGVRRRWVGLALAASLALVLAHVVWIHLRVLPGMRSTIAEAAVPSLAALPLLASTTRADGEPIEVPVHGGQRSVFLAVAPGLPAELADSETLRIEVRERTGNVRFVREMTVGQIRVLLGRSGAFALVLPASALPDGEGRLHIGAGSRGDLLDAPFVVRRD